MIMLGHLGPSVAILLAVLICALPWGLPAELRLVLPLLPYAVIHCCVERRPEATPDWLVFLAGFATDVVGQGPLGYWALIYLCGYTMIRSVTAQRSQGLLSSVATFAVTISLLALMQWSVASVYYLRPADTLPLVVAAAVAGMAHLLAQLLFPLRSEGPQRVNSRLERGR